MKFSIFLLCFFLPLALYADVKKSVVLISNASQSWRFDQPWKKTGMRRGTGTGFIIKGNRIMTNAHVVSNSRYLEVKRLGDHTKYVAKVINIAHDCDLAILEIVGSPNFFKTMVPLEFGYLPKINSTVTTYGFPVGGSQISVTQGVVSRIQQSSYSHSGNDSHLVIQTDAAINPGNSGGPVMQKGKVVGVAFQGLRQADNIGYLIPTSVVRHLLKDIEDGKVDGFGEIGIHFRYDLQNPMVRSLLKLPKDSSGVLITRTFPNMPSDNMLKVGDVITEVDKYSIGNDGYVLLDGREIEFTEVMERLQVGEKIKMKIWRDKKEVQLELPMIRWKMVVPHHNPYDETPPYYIYGGMCFTPLSRGYLATLGGWKKAPLSVRQLYLEIYGDKKFVKHKECPVFSTLLPHEVNQGAENFQGLVIEKVNGEVVKSMRDLKNKIEKSNKEFIHLKFIGQDIPLVLLKKATTNSNEEILNKYHIKSGERL
jgi:S1-C subfamily serine protease